MSTWGLILISHVFAALTAVLLGIVQLVRRKGGPRHKAIGRVWAVLMYWAALSSFLIRQINDGAFSFLHILSLVTLISVTRGLITIRRGDVRKHRANMIGSWIGSVGALIFALVIPARDIPTFAVNEPLGALAAFLTVLGTTALVVFIGDRIAQAGQRREREAASEKAPASQSR